LRRVPSARVFATRKKRGAVRRGWCFAGGRGINAPPRSLPMMSARYAPYLFGLILSGLMSCVVSGIATVKALGLGSGVFAAWMEAWAFSWAVAFPTVLFVAPFARRVVARITRPAP
jgi:hypothetical protein